MKFFVSAAAMTLGAVSLTACTTPDATREASVRAEIDAQLQQAEREGLICEYRQTFGSLRRERVCFSPEEVEQNAQNGRTQVERMQRATMPVSGS